MTTRALTTSAIIGNTTVPIISWQCHLNSYGNLSSFEVKTSIKALKDLNYNIFTEQKNNFTLECKIILIDNTAGNSEIVFDGIIDSVEGIWEEDIIEITGRDYSAVLRDKDVTLDKYVNSTVSQVVQGLANDNKIQSFVQGVDANGNSTDPNSQIAGIRASTFQGEDWAMSTHPQPAWHVIQQLADEVGYVAYMDQHKVLHFVPPAMGTSHSYFWRPSGDIENPIMNLSITQQSREYDNFTLRVHGYDPNGKETIYKDVVRGTGAGHFYNKSRQDLTGANYVQIANNLANEIQQKNLVVKMTVEGNLDLNVNDKLTVFDSELNDLLGLDNSPLFITGLLHSFEMPDYDSAESAGFLTHITANQAVSTST